MKDFLEITRSKIFKAMKIFLFFVPIGIITSNIYIWQYGNYNITLNISYIINNLNVHNTIVTSIIFIIISFVAYVTENMILPEIIILTKQKNPTDEMINLYKKFSHLNFGLDIIAKSKESSKDEPVKLEVIQELMFWPVVLVLWLLTSNNILGYISILIVLWITVILGKFINGTFDQYQIK